MKRLFMVCTLVLLVLSVQTQAAPTITYVETVEADTGYFLPDGYIDSDLLYNQSGDNDGYYRWHNEDWGWTHTFSTPDLALTTIISATLEIRAYDVDSPAQENMISADGTDLGTLVGVNKTWSTTTFDLDFADVLDGTIDIWMDIDSTHTSSSNVWWAAALESSTLTVVYETEVVVDVPDPSVPPTQAIPAPGAILLGSLGAGIVSWLRRRRTL